MQKIKIRLPATITGFGPGPNNLGLALNLYTSVEVSARDDEQLIVDTSGEGAGHYATGLRHPVVLAMMRVFQKLENAPRGLYIRVDNNIPLNSGLGAEDAFMAAGVIGANNLMGGVYNREQLLELAAQVSPRPDSVIASILGGLTAGVLDEEQHLIYRTLPLNPFTVVVAVPELHDYHPPDLPERVSMEDAEYNLHRVPLLVEALRTGDLSLLTAVLEDRIYTPRVTPSISGYAHVAEIARLAGALAVTTSGSGPAMVIIAERGHERIAEVVETAFQNLEISARVYVLPVDTQGIVVSMMQSA